MSKEILLAAVMAVSAVAVAVTSYISPAAPSDINVPPIEIELPVNTVVRQLEYLTAELYIAHIFGRSERIPSYLNLQTVKVDDNHVKFVVRIGGDLVGEATATVIALNGNRSSIDIVAHLTESKFAQHPALHPYDAKAMESIADLMITDYVYSVLKAERMASKQELEIEIISRIGFSAEQARAFSQRIEDAFEGSYSSGLKNAIERDRHPSYADPSYIGDEPHQFGEPMMQPNGINPSATPRYNPSSAYSVAGTEASASSAAAAAGREAAAAGAAAAAAADAAGAAAAAGADAAGADAAGWR